MEKINIFWEGYLLQSVQQCIDSWVKNGHKVNLWSYQSPAYLNCNLCDANTILSFTEFPERFGVIDKADWFRINLIYQLGGWYADADCYCIRSLQFEQPNIVTWFNDQKQYLNNCIFKFEKGSEYLKKYIDHFDFEANIPGYRQFGDLLAPYFDELLICDSKELSFQFIDSIPTETKVIHLFNSIDEEKNLGMIEKIKTLNL